MLHQSEIKSLYHQINRLEDLKPSKKVNTLFSKLVELSLNTETYNNLSGLEIKNLQTICSKSEFEMEKYWSTRIIRDKNPKLALTKFPYFSNYKKLTRMEWYSLVGCSNHQSHNALFIGGGPLPLSAIVLALDFGIDVTVLEKDINAVKLSEKLIRKLGLAKRIKVIHKEASSFDNYNDFTFVVVAALAGLNTSDKVKILKKIKDNINPNSHILARSSWGIRKILYRPLDKSVFKMFKPQIEVRPHNDIVNSIVIFSS